jgi:fatty-acyl-CoA synthase
MGTSDTMHDTEGRITRARRHALGDLLARTAARTPAKTAVIWRDTEESYAEFDAAVNRAAHALADRGVNRGDRIALFSHNCRDFVAIYFALAKLGAISVPINFMLGVHEVAYILDHSGAVGIVAEDALSDIADQAIAAVPAAGRVRGWLSVTGSPARSGWEDARLWFDHPDRDDPDVVVADDDPIQLMYTSGTESRPKGAIMTSRMLIAQYVSCIVDGGMSEDDVDVHALPFYHCAQLHCFFTPDVYLGATNIILPGPDPALLLRTIEAHRATKLFCPPTVWIGLLRSPAFAETDLSSLQKGYYGASPMPAEVLRELSERLPHVQLWNFYGQTEMAPLATILKPHEQMSRIGSAGRPSINVETRIVDDEGLPVAAGTIGEIVHRSPQATTGYWNDPHRTAEAFRSGWFHSGDLGVVDDEGYLTIVDRKKDMIKSGGENVASREVEEALFEHPDVAEVAVFGIPHPYWVEAVTAAVVAKPGATVTTDALAAHARTRLAGYKVPKYIELVDALPKNPSGKILKRTLREHYAHLATDSDRGAVRSGVVQ